MDEYVGTSAAIFQLSVAAAVLVYGILIAKKIPPKFHFVSNLSFAGLLLIVASSLGLSFTEAGISFSTLLPGLWVGILASIGILFVAYVLTSLPFLKKYFLSQHSILRAKPSQIAYETAVRIPFSTALSEEILFRGVLLGIFLQFYSSLMAVILSSLLFGLWHVFPTINSINSEVYLSKADVSSRLRLLRISATVATTALAGVFFAWLRLISGSIIAPWMAHWTINSSGVLTVLFVRSREGRK